MSYFDILPVELQETIIKYKYELETKNLKAFVDDFDMKIISIIKTNESKDIWGRNHIIRYNCKVNLTYKPTSKSIITLYSYGIINCSNKLPCKYDIVQSLSFDAYWFREGDWTYLKNSNGEWYRNFSYDNHVQQGQGTPMSYKQFIFWKNSVQKIEIMLGDKFNKFMQYYNEDM
jgi:hypothetical protein